MKTSHPPRTVNRLRGVLIGAVHLFTARTFDVMIRALFVLMVARFLGTAEYGLFSYGQSYYLSMLWFASFGIDVMLANASGRGREKLARTARHTLALRLLVIALLTLASLAGAWLVHEIQETRKLLSVFAIALLARGIYGWALHVLITIGHTSEVLYINAVARSVELILAIAVLLSGGSLLALAWTHSLIWCITAMAAMALVHREHLPIRPMWNFRMLKAMAYRGQPLSLLHGATSLLLLAPLILFPHLHTDSDALGQFALIMQGIFVMASIGWSVGIAALPALSRDIDGMLTHRYLKLAIRLGWLLGITGALAGFALGPMMVELLLGTSYGVAGDFLGYALLVLAPVTWGATFEQVLLAGSRRSAALACALGGTAAMVLATVLLIPRYGVAGGTAALLIGNSVWAAATMAALFRTRQINASDAFIKPGCTVLLLLGTYGSVSMYSPILALAISALLLVPFASVCGMLEGSERRWILQRLGIGKARRPDDR